MTDKTPTPEEICITTNDDRLQEVVWDENMVTARRLWSAKVNLNKVIAQVNIQSEQIRELQLATFTFNKVLHLFRAALDEFDETTVQQGKRITHLEELLLESSDDDEYPIVRRNEQTEKWEKVEEYPTLLLSKEYTAVTPTLDHLMNHHNSDEEEIEYKGVIGQAQSSSEEEGIPSRKDGDLHLEKTPSEEEEEMERMMACLDKINT